MATGNLLFAMRPEKGDTPASIRRKRELADAIMGRRSQGARNVGEGIGSAFESIGDGIAARIMNKRADASEQAGLASVEADMDPINAGLAGFPAAPGGDSVASAPVDYASQRVAQAHGGGNYRDAIASIESAGSGDYAAIGPTHPKLGRALGRYQVMEANIGPWSREALGREVTPDAFLADPKLQDAIFDSKFGGYVKQFGSPEAAAQAWFGGPGGVGKTDRKDVLGTTIGQYGEKFNKALGGQGQPMSSPAPVQVASLDPAAGMSAPEQPAPALPAPRMVPDMPIAAPQPAPAPQQVAQAQDPSSLPVTAGGTAGAIQPGQSAGPSLQQLLQAAQNPWLNDNQRQVVNMLLEQEMQKQDPMRQLQMQKLQQDVAGGGVGKEFQQRAMAAQQYGLDPNSEEGRAFILSGKLPESRGGAAELGLNPQYGIDENGNPALIQIGKDGKAVKTALPEGITLSKEPIKLDAGTHFVLLDPITRQPVGQIPKELGEAEAQKAAGKAQGEASFDLPRVEQNATQTLGILDRMETHPGREGSTGFIQGLLPSRSSDQVDFQSLVDQTQGQSFLQAFQMLKGGGQITEIEGQKATDAISRLRNQRLGDKDYLQAIADLKGVINAGLERARKQAGGSAAPSSPGEQQTVAPKRLKFNPATGELE